MKNILCILSLLVIFTAQTTFAQSRFVTTTDTFRNREIVWNVQHNGSVIGQFWPIHYLKLVTGQTDPIVSTGTITQVQTLFDGVATTPGSMTGESFGSYTMQGKALSNGRPCGDGVDYDYGIIVVDKDFSITFTHHREHNTDSLYQAVQARKGTMFYLPSIMRNGNTLSSNKTVDKVLVRRMTPDGEQIGVMLFNGMMTYNDVREIIAGLDRAGAYTTHIYVLDGGSTWGQSCKEVNGVIKVIGSRDPAVITNYLIFY